MEHDNRITDTETARWVKRSMEQQKRAAFWGRVCIIGIWMWVGSVPILFLLLPFGAATAAPFSALFNVIGLAMILLSLAASPSRRGVGDVDRYYDSVNDG